MSDPTRRTLDQITVDVTNLHREDVYTDLGVATLRKMTPVREDGSDDPSRPAFFVVETQIVTQVGLLPVSAHVEAATLADAIAKFPEAIRGAVEQMMEEAREMQRREATRIVTAGPGAIPPAGGLGGAGGGKLHLR